MQSRWGWRGLDCQRELGLGVEFLTNCLSVMVDASADNNRADLVVVLDCLVQRLEDQTANTFTSRKAGLGAVVEGKCLAVVIIDTSGVSLELGRS